MKARTEGDVMREIRAYVEACGVRLFRVTPGVARLHGHIVQMATKGLPDLFGCLPGGRFLAIEVKKPGARKRANEAAQNEVLDYLEAQGAFVIRNARSVDDVAKVIGWVGPPGSAPKAVMERAKIDGTIRTAGGCSFYVSGEIGKDEEPAPTSTPAPDEPLTPRSKPVTPELKRPS